MTITTPPHYQALLAAVIADRDDDTPRLVMADWLEENGDGARGEFIRVQCELARWPCECDSEERVYHEEDCRCNAKFALQRRERELLHAHGSTWIPPVGERPVSHTHARLGWSVETSAMRQIDYTFRRGFVTVITCSAADWCQHADAINAATPLEGVMLR